MDIKDFEDKILKKRVSDEHLREVGIDVRIARFRQALDREATERIILAHKLPMEQRRAAIQEVHDWVLEMKRELARENLDNKYTVKG